MCKLFSVQIIGVKLFHMARSDALEEAQLQATIAATMISSKCSPAASEYCAHPNLLTCPKCKQQGPSGFNNNRSIFSPSQRTFKRVTLNTVNVRQNCCKVCSPWYFLEDEPVKMVHLDANKDGRRDLTWMPCSARPNRRTPPRANFAPEVSQKQFQLHRQECKANFPGTFWM